MGSNSEHFAVTVYLGEEAYWKFVDLHDNGPMGNPGKVLEIGQLQLSYDNKMYLQKEDKAVIKDLGRKYRDPKECPMFRSFKDGFFPWFLTPEEVKIIAVVLEQARDMFIRIQNGFLLPDPMNYDYLARIADIQHEQMVWKEKTIYVNPPSEVTEQYTPDQDLLKSIKALPSSNQLLEFDYSLLLNPIRENKSERPFYPALALLVDHRHGFVVGSDVFGEKCGSSQRLSEAPGILLNLLSRHNTRPKGIDIIRPELLKILGTVIDNLGIHLRLRDELPMIEEAREALTEHFNRV